MKKTTHCGHRKRLRERFLHGTVYDHELLELALYYVRPLVNTNSMAHELINKFKNISGVLNADIKELLTVDGIGMESAVYLKILLEGVRRYLNTSPQNVLLSSYGEIEDYFSNYFDTSPSEVCTLINISSSLELLNTVTLTNDQIGNDSIAQREIVGILLKNKIYRLIVGINHADTCLFPKPADFRTAMLFSKICKTLGIDFVDMVVCSKNSAFSMHKNRAFRF